MISIGKASTEDIEAIQSVAEIAFPATYAEILSPGQQAYMMEWMYSETSLRRQMLDEGHIYYIARAESSVPVGYVSIQRQGSDLFHLQKIYVLPEWQGKQIGRRLFEQAIRAVKELHPAPCTVELNVNRSNPARGFYERIGMRVVREGDFPIGGGYYMNDYIMGIEV
ncbi:GNAT family N-acetyltransferase [uncultured Rikenella sp.]|uniref:GNAT family N-acetyltransferase n=1 Tax=uncultured Rikenella sp. TaxID=368003 RepID=UPI00260C6A90|nr:GNAT family N-acetyltransferase [uncultured Rikenella sp.]